LHEILCGVLGTRNVFFQPPASVQMKYPAVVYGLNDIENTYSDDGVYLSNRRYLVTVIDDDPDSAIRDRMALLPYCRFSRAYTAENLNHYAFNLYF
jgi:hypothetical protein